jgi:crotonobetainyl-CoA:carnitine CoA-transferase CaiB-like acyl-CoA transferase
MGTFITGPCAGMLLADLGARVIKIEQPGSGDPFRAFKGTLYSPHFQTWNRNKQSVTLDTRGADDLAAFDALVAQADVFIQNFRPGVAKKLGVDWERLHAINPRLVYASISGFGATGPDADQQHVAMFAQDRIVFVTPADYLGASHETNTARVCNRNERSEHEYMSAVCDGCRRQK